MPLIGLATTYSHWPQRPNTIGATCVSLASSECIEWFHTAILTKPTSGITAIDLVSTVGHQNYPGNQQLIASLITESITKDT